MEDNHLPKIDPVTLSVDGDTPLVEMSAAEMIAEHQGRVEMDPTMRIARPRDPKPEPEVRLSTAELAQLISEAEFLSVLERSLARGRDSMPTRLTEIAAHLRSLAERANTV